MNELVMTEGSERRSAVHIGLLLSLLYAPFLVLRSLPIFGCGWEQRGSELFMLVPMLALVVGVISTPLLMFDRLRANAARRMVICAVLIVGVIPAAWIGGRLRSYGFRLAAARAQPIVDAMHEFVRVRREFPSTIDDLIPEFLATIPEGVPPLRLEFAAPRYGANDWVLIADTPIGLLNWDEFHYWPNGNYPRTGFGGSFERIGSWAYLHE